MLGMNAFYPYTAPWNHAGTPAVSVPAGRTDDGLPLAVQLIARRGDDAQRGVHALAQLVHPSPRRRRHRRVARPPRLHPLRRDVGELTLGGVEQ